MKATAIVPDWETGGRPGWTGSMERVGMCLRVEMGQMSERLVLSVLGQSAETPLRVIASCRRRAGQGASGYGVCEEEHECLAQLVTQGSVS